jgi:RNA polymerase sigma-70 factor (ECF subfamily)
VPTPPATPEGTPDRTPDFDEFYRSSRDRIAMQIAALTGDRVEAQDHVQEAFVRAWARWSRVGALDDPAGWVRRVAYHLAVSRWRHARRTLLRAEPRQPGVHLDPEQGAVVDALRGLSPREREAVVLHHVVGLPVDAVARELHAPVGTVKSWLSRGRARLAETLEAESLLTRPDRSTTEELSP